MSQKDVRICIMQGIVSDDAFGASGFYELDSTVTLCLSYLKLITSVPLVRKGDKVTIYNAHRVKNIEGRIILYLCGKGHLINRYFLYNVLCV